MEYQIDMIEEPTIIWCENITKEFESAGNALRVIDGLSLEVYENEFLVLFGPGQCGKTTLLNVIAGLEPPTSGNVYLHNTRITGPDERLGMVYQSVALFPWLTVMENVEFGPKARGIAKSERQQRSQELIDLVGLDGFEKSYPNQLSGGMKQRVGIARAYCNRPEVLLMDEPFGSLDAQTRYKMEAEINRISNAERRTVVFVTNNIEEALFLADRVILLRNSPTSVKREYVVKIPKPRDRTSQDFLHLRQEITSHMDKSDDVQEGGRSER